MSELYTKAAVFRRQLAANTTEAVDELTQAHGQIWTQLDAELRELGKEIAAARTAGQEISESWLLRQERLKRLLQQAEVELQRWADHASEQVRREQARAVLAAQADAHALMQAAYAGAPAQVQAVVAFDALPVGAVESLVGFASNGTPLRRLFDGFGANASKAIRHELIVGLATGRNPKRTAAAIRQELNGDLVRARRIARTETLRSYREATRRVYEENQDVIPRWRWTCAKQARTCACCLAMDGREFPVTETLNGHPNCRCTMTPVTATWAELGFPDIPDRRPKRETGEEWLKRQPVAVQEKVLGKDGQKAFAAGDVELGDFVRVKRSKEWGSMRCAHSLKGARRAAAKRQGTPTGTDGGAVAAATGGPGKKKPSLAKAPAQPAVRAVPPVPPEEVIAAAEKEIAPIKTHEVGIGFRPDGTELFRQAGKPGVRDRLSFTDAQLALLKDNILTHNHWNGASFSVSDVKFAIEHDLQEMRVVGINDLGERYTYSLRRPEGGWGVTPDRARDTVRAIDAEITYRRWEQFGRRELTVRQAERIHRHAVMERAARELGFGYVRVKHDE